MTTETRQTASVAQTGSAERFPAFVLSLVGVLAFVLIACAYSFYKPVYAAFMDLFSFDAFPKPFLDTEYVAAQVQCWRQGIDVYRFNPCDPLGRLHDYSPLWLRIPFLTTGDGFVFGLGIGQAFLFLLALAALPPLRRNAVALAVAALFSPVTMFALERGNPDLMMFECVVAAIVMVEKGPRLRIIGYALITLAALLKFYPVVALFSVLREPLRRMALILGLCLLTLIGYFALNWAELLKMVPNLPPQRLGGYVFGADLLAAAIVLYANLLSPHTFGPTAGRVITLCIEASLFCSIALVASAIARSSAFQAAFRQLSHREFGTLLGGAVMMVGCFFAGRSSNYREIFFILVIPGLVTLSETVAGARLKFVFEAAAIITAGIMWVAPVQRLVYHYYGPIMPGSFPTLALIFLIIRELFIWALMAVLGSVVLRVLLDRAAENDAAAFVPSWLRRVA